MKKFLFLSSLLAFSQISVGTSGQLFARPIDKIDKIIDKADVKTVQLKITGLTCAGCASQVNKALTKQAGILENKVEYPGDVATIKYDAAKISEAQIIAAIEKIGYKAQVLAASPKSSSLSPTKNCCAKKSVI